MTGVQIRRCLRESNFIETGTFCIQFNERRWFSYLNVTRIDSLILVEFAALDECDMSTGQTGWHASWKRGKAIDSVIFAPLFDHTFLPVAKWPDKLEVQAHYTKSIKPFRDWWRQSMQNTGILFYSVFGPHFFFFFAAWRPIFFSFFDWQLNKPRKFGSAHRAMQQKASESTYLRLRLWDQTFFP